MEDQKTPLFETENQQPNVFGNQQVPLPNASVVLILGIVSIIGCCCYGIIGIICGIIALVMAKSANATYVANPSAYTESSYSNLKTGRICAMVGLILSALYMVLSIIFILIYGIAALADPQSILNSMNS